MSKMYKSLNECLESNTEILTKNIIDWDDLPRIYSLYFRFESFGDLNNEIQLINYFNICRKNPEVKFALWSKNLFIIDKAIKEGHHKPDNLMIIASSPFLNKIADYSQYEFVDKVFTVYTKDAIEKKILILTAVQEVALIVRNVTRSPMRTFLLMKN